MLAFRSSLARKMLDSKFDTCEQGFGRFDLGKPDVQHEQQPD